MSKIKSVSTHPADRPDLHHQVMPLTTLTSIDSLPKNFACSLPPDRFLLIGAMPILFFPMALRYYLARGLSTEFFIKNLINLAS